MSDFLKQKDNTVVLSESDLLQNIIVCKSLTGKIIVLVQGNSFVYLPVQVAKIVAEEILKRIEK